MHLLLYTLPKLGLHVAGRYTLDWDANVPGVLPWLNTKVLVTLQEGRGGLYMLHPGQ